MTNMSHLPNTIIKTMPTDNVGIVTNQWGMTRGTKIFDQITVVHDIPMGHKVALEDIKEGEEVIRYGHVIGIATQHIPAGSWVSETNIRVPQPPDLRQIIYEKRTPKEREPLHGYTFEGFRNADGSVGTKNVLGYHHQCAMRGRSDKLHY